MIVNELSQSHMTSQKSGRRVNGLKIKCLLFSSLIVRCFAENDELYVDRVQPLSSFRLGELQ